MIHKVNRPAYLSLVESPKKPNMDPGSSGGSGNAYENAQNPSAKNDSEEKQDTPSHAKPAEVLANEQIGMNEVVKDFLEQKRSEVAISPGLTTRYANDSQPAKGLLLNKKVE